MTVQVIRFAPGLKPVLKHLDGQHDQSTHGSWAGDSVSFKQDRNSLTMQDKNGNTLASVDFVNLGNNRLDIDSIDSFDEGKGYATKVLEKLYSSFPEHSIFWGKTIVPTSTHLAQKFSDKYGRTEFLPWGEGVIAGYEWGQLYGDTTVKKHGTHDQKTHGNWATGNFNEDTQGEEAQGIYFDKYGIKTDGSKEPVGISRDEVRSLDDYTADGYKKINQYLRLGGTSPYEEGSYYDRESRGINENRVADLDKLIEESPELFGDKNLYRVFADEVLRDLNEGDILTDKAFLSTTRVDITDSKNIEVLENIQMISESMDRTAIILPNPTKSGKGLAVDYIKNAVSDLFNNIVTADREKEVILPRNTPLKYMGLKKVNMGTRPNRLFDGEQGTDLNTVIAVFQRMDK